MKWQSKIGLGSVQFGLPYGISNKTGQTPIEEVSKIFDLAYANGVRIIDTASGYGTSESVIGILNDNRFSIVSKFGPSSSVADIRQQLENSLSALNAKSLYGYLAHRPLDLLENPIIWQELQKLRTENNKIRKIGFSLNAPDEYFKLKSAGMTPDLVQVPFNYFDTRFRKVLIELKAIGCEVHTRSTFLQGLFFTDTEKLSPFFDELKPNLQHLHNTYKNALEGALLKYVLQQDFIDVVIMGVENTTQLTANLKSIAVAPELETLTVSFAEKLIMPMHWPKD
jgi:aryl-alcohol dehydrogenase-like predicted oxidoreductase